MGLVMRNRIAVRLLGVALIVAVTALCSHAIGHWHPNAYDELHCQACQAGHSANPQPPAHAVIQRPVPIARFLPANECAPDVELVGTLSVPRAPPA
jgi:hypothetical protein